jgi:hypothetical protein
MCVSFLGWQMTFSILEGQGGIPSTSFGAKVLGSILMTVAIFITIGLAWFLTGLMFGYQ